jgi:nucleotide-binding universal stress UspA family protein
MASSARTRRALSRARRGCDLTLLSTLRFREHADHFAQLVRTIGLSKDSDQVHLLRGEPSTELPLFVRDHEIDLLIMGTVARRGISGLLIGNTADGMMNQVACSILALKPSGFQSPVSSDFAMAGISH